MVRYPPSPHSKSALSWPPPVPACYSYRVSEGLKMRDSPVQASSPPIVTLVELDFSPRWVSYSLLA